MATRGPKSKATDYNKRRIISQLVKHGCITKASEHVGISRRTLYNWRAGDSVFDMQVIKAIRGFKYDHTTHPPQSHEVASGQQLSHRERSELHC